MEIMLGKRAVDGIAIGYTFFYAKRNYVIRKSNTNDVEKELDAYERSKEKAIDQINELYKSAIDKTDEKTAEIFNVQQMMLEDPEYNKTVTDTIKSQKVNADYAVAVTEEKYIEMFEKLDDPYFNARALDIRDISERLISILSGDEGKKIVITEPSIILAEEISPTDTIQFDKKSIIAFVARKGSSNSHASILAKSLGIPFIVGIDVNEKLSGKYAIVDGKNGNLIVDPNEKTIEQYTLLQKKYEEEKLSLEKMKDKESITSSGHKIKIMANAGNIDDVNEATENGAEGIGLFRSEILFLNRNSMPTEDEQFSAYKKIAEIMSNKKVIIRTLDLGADKKVSYLNLDEEENPAMGCRGIRISLTQPEILKIQIRAILRASMYGNISIMYPMITSLQEIRELKEIVEETKRELDEEKIEYRNVEQGIMVETPAAAMMSDILSGEVDFFSIGTNDLTQYTLAIDRENSMVERFFDQYSEAVLRLIELTVKNGHENGIWVGICGELGSDVKMTKRFLDMGVDELSVSPKSILKLRKAVREL